MDKTTKSPDAYLAAAPDEYRDDLFTIDSLLVESMPGRSRTLWEGVFWGGTEQTIIGYGDLTQPRPNGESVEWFIIGLSRQKAHTSLYVNAVEDGQYLGAIYGPKLGKVKLGAASIGIKRLEHVDLDVLALLASHAHRISPQ
ncbi:MAG: hypothetical protein R8J94_21170 [Acidimicrobiia bacterium]|nr:hypothetical protein [Acidimicrobiia bacterium]